MKDSTVTIAIASLDDDRAEGIVIFRLVNNSNGYTNESSNIAIEVDAVRIGIKGKYGCQESTQAYEITELMKSQLQSVNWNSSTPIALQDLQWNSRPDEESYRQQFLETCYRCNAISALRALGNYYAANSSRYTTIQSHLLMSCSGITHKNPKRCANEDRSFKFLCLKESQSYRVILADERSNTTAERREAIEDQSEYERSVVHQNSTSSETDRLKKENELLGLSLRKAAELHVGMLSAAEANLKESDKLMEERRALEKERKEFLAEKKKLELWNDAKANSLLDKEKSLEKQREEIECAKRNLAEEKKALEDREKLNEDNVELLKKQREEIDCAKRNLAEEKKALEDREKLNEDNVESLKKQREEIDCAKRNLAEEKKALQDREKLNADNLKNREKMMEQNYEAKTSDLTKETERMRLQYEARNRILLETERSMDTQRRNLESEKMESLREKQKLETEAEDLRRNRREIEVEHAEAVEYCRDWRISLRNEQEKLEWERRSFEIDMEMSKDYLSAQQREFESKYCAYNEYLKKTETAMKKERQELNQQKRNLKKEQGGTSKKDTEHSCFDNVPHWFFYNPSPIYNSPW